VGPPTPPDAGEGGTPQGLPRASPCVRRARNQGRVARHSIGVLVDFGDRRLAVGKHTGLFGINDNINYTIHDATCFTTTDGTKNNININDATCDTTTYGTSNNININDTTSTIHDTISDTIGESTSRPRARGGPVPPRHRHAQGRRR
jgi:hypothetical protein